MSFCDRPRDRGRLAGFTRSLVLGGCLALAAATSASADYAAGVAAYDRSDYRTAFQEFSDAARQGRPEAKYRLGLLYAAGLGTPGNDLLALKWLICVTEGTGGRWLKMKAEVRLAVIGGFRSEARENAGKLAERDCGVTVGPAPKSYALKRVKSGTERSGWVANLLLYPGDMLILLLAGIGEFFDMSWLTKLLAEIIEFLGDVFPAIAAVLVWGLVWRILFAVFESSSGGPASSSAAGRGRWRLGRRKSEDELRRDISVD